MELYNYRAKIVSVYDGDTVRANIDLGFGIINNGIGGKGVKLRLYGIDTPELRGDNKEEGLKSRDRLRELILDKDVIIHTIKDKQGKYGRYLAIIWVKNGEGVFFNANDKLVEEGLAEIKYY